MARKKSKSEKNKNSKESSKKKNKKSEKDEGMLIWNLEEHVAQALLALLFFVLAVFFTLSYFEQAGIAGEHAFSLFERLLGYGYFLLPLSMFILSINFLRKLKVNFAVSSGAGITLFMISGLGLINIATDSKGGVIGNLVSDPLLPLFDLYVTFVLLAAMMILSFVLLFDLKLSSIDFNSLKFWKKDEEDKDYLAASIAHPAGAEQAERAMAEEERKNAEKSTKEEGRPEKPSGGILSGLVGKQNKDKELDIDSKLSIDTSRLGAPFTPPPLKLLTKDSGKPSVGDVKTNANVIKRTLSNFGIDVEMDEVSVGPTVTRYALKPAEGVKLSRIEGLQKEIQAALAAKSIRIEAPIPGKSLVGIEVPNISKATVGLASLFSDPAFAQSDNPLLVALGRNLSGEAEFADFGKMPHLLVAGATGAGKSVTVHMLIASLLYRNSPENLRFIMVDPKRVELTPYNDIPHLLTPVIKNAKKAILALKWAAKEMERRYDILESYRVQNIDSYHKNILEPAIKDIEKKRKNKDSEEVEDELPESMPYIVIVIDELADIMSAYPKELEAAIVRLAQMSRAVGIHLILSTQRPDVRVITGLIKANIPSRIALQVSSQIDSRTIIDKAGAERLLGKGDMLYQGGEMAKPARIQSGFVTEEEIKRVVDWLIKHYSGQLPDTIDLDSETRENNTDSIFSSVVADESSEEDEKFEEAKQTVMEAGRASTSYLQRKLGVGYSRAAKLIDMLEEQGIIGPQNGSKPREVLAKGEESEEDSSESYEENTEEDNQKGLSEEDL
ncbi:MAG: DNA translocase FtsK [Candidatus Campbellbacteria bacterium]|nr:DNA translocase FtsK [Candidatus Campbellbacteria bacterium]